MPSDAKIELTILGSGSAVPQLQRCASANLLQCNGHMVLVDCGRGCIERLLQQGVDPNAISHICLTHFHIDHCGELPALVFGRYNNREFSWQSPLHIIGGLGLTSWWRHLCLVWPSLQKPFSEGLVVLDEICDGQTLLCDIGRIIACATDHKPESLAYKFECGGKQIVISGDTGPETNLAIFAQNVDLLLLECAGGLEPLNGHLDIISLAEIAKLAMPNMLVITHFYPWQNIDTLMLEFSKLYKGAFVAAHDLLTLEV